MPSHLVMALLCLGIQAGAVSLLYLLNLRAGRRVTVVIVGDADGS